VNTRLKTLSLGVGKGAWEGKTANAERSRSAIVTDGAKTGRSEPDHTVGTGISLDGKRGSRKPKETGRIPLTRSLMGASPSEDISGLLEARKRKRKRS